ncbi:hypothetical protein AgCh_010449 [Apium graveolens]
MGESVVNAPYVQNKNCTDYTTSNSGTEAEHGTLYGQSLVEEVDLDTNSLSEVSSSLVNESAETDRNGNAIECQNSLVQFIHQEAQEKANEISVSAEEEFNIKKLQIVEAEKKKIRQEFERMPTNPYMYDSDLVDVLKGNMLLEHIKAWYFTLKLVGMEVF